MLKGEGKFPSGLDKPLKTCIFNRTAGLLTKQIYDRLTHVELPSHLNQLFCVQSSHLKLRSTSHPLHRSTHKLWCLFVSVSAILKLWNTWPALTLCTVSIYASLPLPSVSYKHFVPFQIRHKSEKSRPKSRTLSVARWRTAFGTVLASPSSSSYTTSREAQSNAASKATVWSLRMTAYDINYQYPPQKQKNKKQNTIKNSSLSKIIRTSTVQESMVNEPYISYVDIWKKVYFLFLQSRKHKKMCAWEAVGTWATPSYDFNSYCMCAEVCISIYIQYDYLRNAHRVRKSSMHCRQYMSVDETKTHSPTNSAPHIQKRYQRHLSSVYLDCTNARDLSK